MAERLLLRTLDNAQPNLPRVPHCNGEVDVDDRLRGQVRDTGRADVLEFKDPVSQLGARSVSRCPEVNRRGSADFKYLEPGLDLHAFSSPRSFADR